jgi:hypothetical protein
MKDKVQKIKDWISKEQDGLMDAQGNFEYPEHEGAYHILCNLDTYIDSLQGEPVSIWHDAKEPPEMYRKYFARYSDGRINGSWERHDDGFIPWKDVIKEHNITHWCYVEDLLKL